ncbi:hypothetical protein CsSME_00005222 [Camellia sinensis var. sinensis]
MGCVSSKKARSPDSDSTSAANARRNVSVSYFDSARAGFGELEKIKEEPEKENEEELVDRGGKIPISKSTKKGNSDKKAVFSLRFGRYTEAEHVAAGWPSWLSAVAGDAINGWLPLRSDSFEKLDKIGQGTYSSVYRAREVETGRIVALKKVRFDTYQPESVMFMAREITILRRLDHPNIMKLEGLITNRLSCSIYLVFEYMEHDLSGLLSCPDIKFSDAQIKCYMRQLLSGLEHCHSHGVMHRDIKASNILVNNEGVLKIADFGLANYVSARHRQELTSRVVTLWYRPPELLLGSTNYGTSVDMWSVGCVFAELFFGKPILKGRTEVEQLHKIFRLCGTPADDYWKKSKLPLASMFKPQHPYISSLRERCKELPKSAVTLLETFLSIEPYKRGTASSALESEYFTTKPYACDPSCMPRYPPNKEIDAKMREEARRRKAGVRARASGTSRYSRRTRKAFQEPSSISKVVPTEVSLSLLPSFVSPLLFFWGLEGTTHFGRRNNGSGAYALNSKGVTESRDSLTSYDTVSEASQTTEVSQVDSIRSVPVITASNDFAWAKKRKGNAAFTRFQSQGSPRIPNLSPLDPSSVLHARDTLDSEEHESEEILNKEVNELYEVAKHDMRRLQSDNSYLPVSFATSELHHSQEFSVDLHNNKKPQFSSGPLFSQQDRLDEGQEDLIGQSVRRSKFSRGKTACSAKELGVEDPPQAISIKQFVPLRADISPVLPS